jgi:hypothetical protein
MELSAFGVISSNKNIDQHQSKSGIFNPILLISVPQRIERNSNLRNNLAIFKLGSKFKPNTNFQFDYMFSLQSQPNRIVSLLIRLHLI